MAATTEHFLQGLTEYHLQSSNMPMLSPDLCICCQSTTQQDAKNPNDVLCKQCKLVLAQTQQAYVSYAETPIHHTLSNATITYDTLYREGFGFMKSDVFLAPAPSAESDSDYETVTTPIMVQQEDPAFLLEEAHSLFGVDGLLSQRLHKLAAADRRPLEDLPTPPAATCDDYEHADLSRKRKRSQEEEMLRVQTPPASPDSSYQIDKKPKCEEEDDNEWDDSPAARSPSPFSWSSRRNSLSSVSDHDDNDPVEPANDTIFQQFTQAEVDWCRYCGTTEGVNWRPGPWGKRTLCNKHGCDYKGYGFACKLPRLNLTEFEHESIQDRVIPVLQLFCSCCQERECQRNMIRCAGCPRAFHRHCLEDGMTWTTRGTWYCTSNCQKSSQARRIVVDLPRKRLPLMSTPKQQQSA